jgi:hypothetical protein
MDKHRAGIEHFNKEQASRNQNKSMGMRPGDREGGTGRDTATIAGSMEVHENTPKSKSPSMGGSSDAKALGRAAAGAIESPRGKNKTESGKKFDKY